MWFSSGNLLQEYHGDLKTPAVNFGCLDMKNVWPRELVGAIYQQ